MEGPKGLQKDELKDLYIQKTNRRFLGLPINTLVWMYYTGEKRYNPEKYEIKKKKVETRFSRKIGKTTNEKRKSSLQYRRQHKIDVLNDKIENGNNPMQWGEKAAVYDSTTIALTAEKITDFLFTEGYFLATTSLEKSESKKKVTVKYLVDPMRLISLLI